MFTCSWLQGNAALLFSLIFFCLITHFIFVTHALYIHQPMYLRGYVPFSVANFGIPYVTSECKCFSVVEADPVDACSTLHTSSLDQYHNRIVFVRRGNCSFVKKALFVEESGGVGMLLWNNEGQESPHIVISEEQKNVMQRLLADKSSTSSGTLSSRYPSDFEITKEILEQLKVASNAVSISADQLKQFSNSLFLQITYLFKMNIYS